ncbi:MAG: LysM peptidoglycan-binding domain-containing protein [Verrucomicrobiota bacterium]
MNTPNPLLPQGSLPQRGKSSIYLKVLMIVAIHTVLIGGILMVGCKNAAKDHASATPADDMAATQSNSSPMSADLTPAPGTAPAPAVVAPPLAGTPLPQSNQLVPPVLATVAPLAAAPPTPGVAREYVIVSGDTLGALAKRNGVSIKSIVDANPGIDAKKLRIGYKLQIPAGSAPASAASAGAAGASATATESSALASGDATAYTVKPGDVLLRIAHNHGTTVKAILALNDMKTTSIKSGQKLKLPVMKVASTDTMPAAPSAPAAAAPAPGETPAPAIAPKTMAN